jgi:O-antigen/teichoic acid export membrane protein
VLYYSSGQVVVRLAGVVGSAYVFRSVGPIFLTAVLLEALKSVGLYIWLRRKGLLVFRWEGTILREQLRFIVPFGSGTLLYNVNESFGKLLVAGSLGPAPLAIYTIAAYQVPILTVLKSALSEVIFPDMVQRSSSRPLDGLKLWQRTNVLYFLGVCPVWMILTFYAEPIIRLLFTDAYVAATPFFQVMLLVMVRQCFDFSTPLRSIGHTAPFVTANVVGLVLNAILTLVLMRSLGLWGPTLGIVVCHIWLMAYLGYVTAAKYEVPVAELLQWSKLFRIALAAAAGLPLFYLVDRFWGKDFMTVGACVGAYLSLYLLAIRLLRIEEAGYIAQIVRRTVSFGRRV